MSALWNEATCLLVKKAATCHRTPNLAPVRTHSAVATSEMKRIDLIQSISDFIPKMYRAK